MKNHPYADLFPMIEGEAWTRFVEDIRTNGLRDPIIVDQQNRIVDGRNRWKACHQIGIEARFDHRTFTSDDEVLSFVVSVNLDGRRHLSESQRGMIAAKVANLKRGGNNNPSGKNQYGGGQSANLPIDQPQTEPQQVVSNQQAAAMLNVSERTVRKAKKVQEKGTPQLAKAVEKGELSLHAAEQVANLPPETQDQIATAPEPAKAAREVVKTLPKPEKQPKQKTSAGSKGEKPSKRVEILPEILKWAAGKKPIFEEVIADQFTGGKTDKVRELLEPLTVARGYLVEKVDDRRYRVYKAAHFMIGDDVPDITEFRSAMKELLAECKRQMSLIDDPGSSTRLTRQRQMDLLQRIMAFVSPLTG